MGRRPFLFLTLVVLAVVDVAACLPPEQQCTDLAAVSVHVLVVDDLGSAVTDAAVTVTPAGGAEAPCTDAPEEPGGFLCGFELSGEVTVRASAPFHSTDEQTVDVPLDDSGCHVVTQQVTLSLTAVDG